MLDFGQVKCVNDFHNLVSTPFQGEVNAICWKRELLGDFSEIIDQIKFEGNIVEVNPKELLNLELSKEGQLARDIILNDLKILKTHGASPVLNVIKYYEKDDALSFFPTDVYSFHVDRSPIPTDTFLCTYHGASSDIIKNSEADQKVLIPEIRKKLRDLYDGPEQGFESFLSEYFFDLHYQPKLNSQPLNLGVGHLWRLAIDHPESKVLPCIHRAPEEKNGENRLLLIC